MFWKIEEMETLILLHKICSFIPYPWSEHWFSKQMFRAEAFEKRSVAWVGYTTALKCLKTHRKTDETPIRIPGVISAASVRSKSCKTCMNHVTTRTTSHLESSCPMTITCPNDFLVYWVTKCNEKFFASLP